jgi:tetratricopeptide (TPR) repeat protein
LRHSFAAHGLLNAYTLIRRHRDLLPNQPVRAALRVFAQEGIDRAESAHVIAALGLLDEDGPGQVTARVDWAMHLLRQHRHRRALHHATRALGLQYAVGDSTTFVRAHLQLADVLGEIGDLPGRADALRRAFEDVGHVDGVPAAAIFDLHCALIDALLDLNRNHEAMSVIDAAEELAAVDGLASAHRDPMLWVLLCRVAAAEEIGATSAAVRAYRRMLDSPELPHHDVPRSWVTTRLASCLDRCGRRKEAIRLLMHEVESAEQRGSGWLAVPEHCALAWLLLEQDPGADVDRHLARCLFDGTKSSWAGFGQVFIILGDLERRDGNVSGAAECYRYALYLAPGPDRPEQPERLPERAERILSAPILVPLPPADGVLSPLIASLRTTLDGYQSPDPLLPDLRVMARERLFHVTSDPHERRLLAVGFLRDGVPDSASSQVLAAGVVAVSLVDREAGPPGGAGVLPLHPGRGVALLDEPGVVDDQDAVWCAEHLGHVFLQVIAEFVRVPAGTGEQSLQTVRGGGAGELGELPAVRTADRAQQAAHVVPHAPRFHSAEPAAHPQKEILKFRCPPTGSRTLDHTRTVLTAAGWSAQIHPWDERHRPRT